MNKIIKKSINELTDEHYNIINFIDSSILYIPFDKKYPFVVQKETIYYLFFFNKDISFSESLLDYPEINDMNYFIDLNLDNFCFDDQRTFNYFKIKEKTTECFLYKNENKLNEIKKHYLLNNDNGEILNLFDISNSMQNKPIKITKRKNYTNEAFYFLDVNGKITLSFDKLEDRPFEVTIENNQKTLDYLIPYLKEKRTSFFKPSLVIMENNNVIDYKYIVNNKDRTDDATLLLNKFGITDPESHFFLDYEIKAFRDLFF